MAVGAIAGIGSIGSHLQIHGASQTHAQAPTQAPGGTRVDRDGDNDNSTPSEDKAEGKGGLVDLIA